MTLCPDCEEMVEEPATFHPECCPHDDVELFDDRDGAYGRIYHFCEACRSEVVGTEPDESGHSTGWEVVP